MKNQFLVGIDIGTQGTKAGLFALNGTCLATAFRASKLHRPSAGAVEEDPEYQVTTVCAAVKHCVAESKIDAGLIAAIAIDGQMAGIIGIGKDGMAVTPYDSWLDTRCAPYITRMSEAAGARIVRTTGCPPSFNHGPKKLWWKHEHPALYRTIASFVQPGAYAAMRLCGLDARGAYIDKSYLHFSGFADNRRGVWDAELVKEFDLDARKLPAIVDSHSVVGDVTPTMAKRCGLKAGTPVVAGCGDTAASFLSCGATRPGICVDVAGTASVFATTTRSFRADVKHSTLGCGRAATPGLWHPYAYINGGGMNLEWFRKQIAGVGLTTAPVTFDRLNAEAAAIESVDGLPVFIPHLGGRAMPSRPGLRGAWAGLSWDHSAGHLYRSILEGVALEYGLYRDIVKQLHPSADLTEIRITGGGEKSDLWNQIKADVLDMRVVQLTRQEGAPLGSALLAGFGVGLFDDLDTAASAWVATGKRYSPDGKRNGRYAARLVRYRALIDVLDTWSQNHH